MGSGDEPGPGTVDARVVRTRNDILSTALRLLHEDGWEAVTHAHLAQTAGYSKATIYKHWPHRTDLVRDAFLHLGDLPHHAPSGDLRADLIAELVMFRDLMRERALERGLAILVDLAMSSPELAAVRDEIVLDGEHVTRALLRPFFDGPELEAASLMLSGTVINSALFHGRIPEDDILAAAVDIVLRARP